MITFVGFQGQLFLRLDSFLSQLLNLSGEDGFGLDSRVDTVGLDRDDNTTAVLQEQVGVKTDNSSLIRLGNICKHSVDHRDEHSIFLWVSGVFNDRNDVRALLCHRDEISAGSMGEFNGVHNTFGSDDVGDVTDGGT